MKHLSTALWCLILAAYFAVGVWAFVEADSASIRDVMPWKAAK
jgi:hypothetical protein